MKSQVKNVMAVMSEKLNALSKRSDIDFELSVELEYLSAVVTQLVDLDEEHDEYTLTEQSEEMTHGILEEVDEDVT